MKRVLFLAQRGLWLGSLLPALVAVLLSGCNNGSSLDSSEAPLSPGDSTPAPPDSTQPPPPADTTAPPPPDTTTPPVDTTTPPPPDSSTPPPPTAECSTSGGSSGAPVHVGIPFGPTTQPASRFTSQFTGTIYTATSAACLKSDMDAARRLNIRLFLGLTGNEQHLRDENGFSMRIWKQRVDRFRGVDLSSYIADGTILGHFIMDEPTDPNNWNGKIVTLPEVEEMARYSKEIWPTMPTLIRTWPDYLKGYEFKHLDAIWFHYLEFRGPLDPFIKTNMDDARAVGLAVVGGLNVLNGGSKSSGIPGRAAKKYGMSASEIRTWGGRFLAEPGLCAFFLWKDDDPYFKRPDIKEAVDELMAKARDYPSSRPCKK